MGPLKFGPTKRIAELQLRQQAVHHSSTIPEHEEDTDLGPLSQRSDDVRLSLGHGSNLGASDQGV